MICKHNKKLIYITHLYSILGFQFNLKLISCQMYSTVIVEYICFDGLLKKKKVDILKKKLNID